MKKPVGFALAVAVIAVAVITFRSLSKPPAADSQSSTSATSDSGAENTTRPAPSHEQAEGESKTAVSQVASADSADPAANRTSVAETPTKPVTTLSELYRTFDAINAAAEATTPESLTTLISFAATENADIRTAALDGLIRRDDASAAPLLRKAAKGTDDPATIIALLETADYLELPSATMTAIPNRPKRTKDQSTSPRRPPGGLAPSRP
jgi:hypothetical protein